MSELWGIDLGGTKIEGVILDPAIGPEKPVCRLRVDTESHLGYEHIYRQIHRVCQMLSEKSGRPIPKRIGMGTPGVADPTTGLLKNSNSQCLNGRPLEKEIEALTGIDFVLANDANLLALAEATFGCARGYPTVFGVILGTGVGGGIIANGRILEGRHGIAGEWGQVTLDPDEQPSAYGTRGTVEAILCGPGLESYYERTSGMRKKLKDIAGSTDVDPVAAATIDRLTNYLAQALAIVIDILDPHAIVLGGGVGNIDELYTEATREKIRARIFNPTFEAALLKPTLGDSAGVFGAAMLAAE
jgi:predicted NBD/HSP70 family sugar kinase